MVDRYTLGVIPGRPDWGLSGTHDAPGETIAEGVGLGSGDGVGELVELAVGTGVGCGVPVADGVTGGGDVDEPGGGVTAVPGVEVLEGPSSGAELGVALADVVRDSDGAGVDAGAGSGASPRIVTICSL